MRTVYREKRYVCGEYLDVYIYPTYSQPRGRSRRRKPTSEAQQKLNQRHREEKLVRLLHANFTPEDLEIHLTYSEQPETPEEAQRQVRNFIRRVQRRRKKARPPAFEIHSRYRERLEKWAVSSSRHIVRRNGQRRARKSLGKWIRELPPSAIHGKRACGARKLHRQGRYNLSSVASVEKPRRPGADNERRQTFRSESRGTRERHDK